MPTQILPKGRSLSRLVAVSPYFDDLCKNILFKKIKQIEHGHLVILDGGQEHHFGDPGSKIQSKVVIVRKCFYSRTLLGGSIGNGESYVDRDWETSDLTNLVRIFVLNRTILQGIDSGLGSLFRPFQELIHGLKGNSIEGSRENIRAHYDMGNDFFKLFLDETMMYSSGVFEDQTATLYEASLRKLEIICERLRLTSKDHLLEIGTGWGSLAIYAAKNYHCKVTTTTISKEQYDYAESQIKAHGLEDQITLLFEDYRNLTGTYDKVVSVEMIEAVGLENMSTYFAKCSSLLKDDGIMVIQAITIRDQFYEEAKKSVDFIQRHIFPGSGIPSVSALMRSVKTHSDLILTEQNDYAEDYAETLSRWSDRLRANESKVVELGYPEYLHRLWQFYFSYCEGGFRERAIGLSQMTFAKPLYRNKRFT